MFDPVNGWQISVDRAGAGGPYILVPRQLVDPVRDLLSANDVPFTMEGFVPDARRGDPPAEPVIRLAAGVDVDRVQALLDAVA